MVKFAVRMNKAWIFSLLLVLPVSAFAQSPSPESRLKTGVELYSQGKWREAVSELRRVQAEADTRALRGEALFWISLSELSAGGYEEALRDMASLEEIDPKNQRVRELPYHRGRIFYYLGQYDEAIVLLSDYGNSFVPGPRGVLGHQENLKKAAALYWTGECLFSMGQLDMAADIYTLITKEYPLSPKYEASVYRLALINQKKVESELLVLLKWTHEEALRNMEDFRRKETTYDQALGAYQKRIANLYERPEEGYREQLESAEERIRFLEGRLNQESSGQEAVSEESNERLLILKMNAQELESLIQGAGR